MVRDDPGWHGLDDRVLPRRHLDRVPEGAQQGLGGGAEGHGEGGAEVGPGQEGVHVHLGGGTGPAGETG